MKHSPEIIESLKLCREAWADHPDATHAWCCHHEELYEKLTEPPEVRIQYILDYKATSGLVLRFNNFRPVTDQAKLDSLYADYRAKLDPLYADYLANLQALYRADVPLGTWNGSSIFQEAK